MSGGERPAPLFLSQQDCVAGGSLSREVPGWVASGPSLTEPAESARWWGPHGFTTPEIALDLSVGGDYRFAMQSLDGDLFHLSGEFLGHCCIKGRPRRVAGDLPVTVAPSGQTAALSE